MNWTNTWPTEPGWYWFHGWTSRLAMTTIKHEDEGRGLLKCTDLPTKARLLPVEVRMAGSGAGQHLVYIARGAFMYQSEGAFGWWQPLAPPSTEGLPEVTPAELMPIKA